MYIVCSKKNLATNRHKTPGIIRSVKLTIRINIPASIAPIRTRSVISSLSVTDSGNGSTTAENAKMPKRAQRESTQSSLK